MAIPYDKFTQSFLFKVNEYDFGNMMREERTEIVDSYMHVAIGKFRKVNRFDLTTTRNDDERQFDVDIPVGDLEDVIEIVSTGMIVEWLKPFYFSQELLENKLNTKDFSTYSPSELLLRVGNAYKETRAEFVQMVRDYSYSTGKIGNLHL